MHGSCGLFGWWLVRRTGPVPAWLNALDLPAHPAPSSTRRGLPPPHYTTPQGCRRVAAAAAAEPVPPQDADHARQLIEAEGSEALLIAADLSEGEAACKKIVDQAGGRRQRCCPPLLCLTRAGTACRCRGGCPPHYASAWLWQPSGARERGGMPPQPCTRRATAGWRWLAPQRLSLFSSAFLRRRTPSAQRGCTSHPLWQQWSGRTREGLGLGPRGCCVGSHLACLATPPRCAATPG